MLSWTFIAYYILISLDCVILLFWVILRAKQLRVSTREALDISLILMLGAVTGARLFHVIYEEPALYLADPFRIFKLWHGGFVFYGGMLTAIILGVSWVKYKKLDLPTWLDFFAPLGAFAYSFGRLSCVFAGCCYGKEAANLPWAVVDHALGDGILRHPTQWYAVVWEFLVLLGLLLIEKKHLVKVDQQKTGKIPKNILAQKGSLFLIWIVLHGVGRLIMEIFRDDPRGDFVWNLSISSWISIILILFGFSYFIKRPNLGVKAE